MLNQQRKAIIFIVTFLLVYAGLTIAYQAWLWWLEPTSDSFTTLVTYILSNLHEHASYQALSNQAGYTFLVNQKPVVRIIEGCNGMAVFITLVSFCAAFQSKIKSYIWFLPLSFILLQSGNVLRLYVLVHFKLMHPHLFELFHTYVFPAAIYGVAFLLMVWWVKFVAKNANK